MAIPEFCTANGNGILTVAVAKEKLSFIVTAVNRDQKPKSTGGDIFSIRATVVDDQENENQTISNIF